LGSVQLVANLETWVLGDREVSLGRIVVLLHGFHMSLVLQQRYPRGKESF